MLVLPLTLNASGAFTMPTVPREASTPSPSLSSFIQPTPAARAAAYGDLLEVAASDRDPGKVRVSSPKGTRTWTASALADHGLPSAARRAYVAAADAMAASDPACQLPWTLLAGVGRVESDHGRYGGSVLGDDGVSRPRIIGVALNGAGPVAAISDTDDGRLDGDRVWDRAVGPMQFIPSTWAGAGRDGDGDGVESPNDIDDAALAAAGYLCSGSGSVLGESAMRAAIFRYNASEEYVALVMAMEQGYRTGVFIMPAAVVSHSSSGPGKHGGRSGRGHKDGRSHGAAGTSSTKAHGTHGGKPDAGQSGGPAPTGGGGNGGPSPNSSGPTSPPAKPPKKPPKPAKPPKPTTEEKTGVLGTCPAGWCLGGHALDLGGDAMLAQTAAHDYNGNGVAGETIQQELEGLAGPGVTVVVSFGTMTVVAIQGLAYP